MLKQREMKIYYNYIFNICSEKNNTRYYEIILYFAIKNSPSQLVAKLFKSCKTRKFTENKLIKHDRLR